ncbi:CHAT domain-containing protein [Kutzneria sp. NPDC052558]|uniref:CHAT domain-containing protein n=1 Tax=Kutzneria sp. NPDC052558 TaxID=3364121 RepID=UPI0037C9940E
MTEVVAGTEIGDAVTAADQAYHRKDVHGVDEAYRHACHLAVKGGQDMLFIDLAVDHASRLMALGDAALALRRCEHHLTQHEHPTLAVLRAEIHSKLGNHTAVLATAKAIRRRWSLSAEENARLLRVVALAAADRENYDLARKLLEEAGKVIPAIDRELLLITLHEGKTPVPFEELRGERPHTAADYLRLALALRREHRYEEAADLLRKGAYAPGVDPALVLPMLCELVVLLRILHQDEQAEILCPRLAEAARWVPDQGAAQEMLDGISPVGRSDTARFTDHVAHARRLMAETGINDLEAGSQLGEVECRRRLGEVERILGLFRDAGLSEREIVRWHLVAGELELALGNLAEAVKHLRVVCSAEATLPAVKASALHLIGHAFHRLSKGDEDDDRAARCWEEAHRIEEDIARRQPSDVIRTGLLLAAATELDQRVAAAVARHRRCGDEETAAAIVVAMEAARGAMILPALDIKLTRDLPKAHDLAGARQWLTETARELPKDQVVWMLHPGQASVHHAVIGRDWVRHLSFSLQGKGRRGLKDAIDGHMAYWHPDYLELSVVAGEFDRTLAYITELLGVAEVIPALLPPGAKRIAIVAGDELSDIPFGGMVLPGAVDHIGLRYALSDLPCLSALRPLRQRSLDRRGDRSLLVSPPDDGLTKSRRRFWRPRLEGVDVSPDNLRARLATHRHRWVRIDSHGSFAHGDAEQSVLKLHEGRLSAAEFRELDLSRCGMAVLGACESGMAQRRGRDERTGFVRAAMLAGAASVLAARWVAEDAAAAAVLDRFERHVRYLPRDLALQRALLDLRRDTDRGHPAWWACWTLYGDAGWQTRVDPIRRVLRRGFHQWRNLVPR